MYIVCSILYSILTRDGSVYGLERDRVFLYDDSTHVLSFSQLRKVCKNPTLHAPLVCFIKRFVLKCLASVKSKVTKSTKQCISTYVKMIA